MLLFALGLLFHWSLFITFIMRVAFGAFCGRSMVTVAYGLDWFMESGRA